MRSLWKGSLAFGLVNVPVKVYSATEDHDIRFHQVHGKDGGRIRYQRVCEKCGKKVEFGDIAKGFESEDGKSIILDAEDFAQLPADRSHEIEVLQFVPTDQIDPILFDKSYYLEPDSKSPKAYLLLMQTLQDTDRLAVVNFALRQKTRLAVLRVRDDVLVVQTMLWPDEVREAAFPALDAEVKISAAEKKMSKELVDSFSGDFEPADFTDTYREQLEEMIAAKLAGKEAFDTDEDSDDGEDAEVLDLLAALKRSVEAKTVGSDDKADKKPPAKKGSTRTAAKKDDDEAKPQRRAASK